MLFTIIKVAPNLVHIFLKKHMKAVELIPSLVITYVIVETVNSLVELILIDIAFIWVRPIV